MRVREGVAPSTIRGWVGKLSFCHGLEVNDSGRSVQGIYIQVGECICCGVGSHSDIPDVRGKMGDELQVSLPLGRKASQLGKKDRSERFVVGKHMELATFHKVAKMTDGEVDGQQFPVKKCYITSLLDLTSVKSRKFGFILRPSPTVESEAFTSMQMGVPSWRWHKREASAWHL